MNFYNNKHRDTAIKEEQEVEIELIGLVFVVGKNTCAADNKGKCLPVCLVVPDVA